jgi:hypothetical protein
VPVVADDDTLTGAVAAIEAAISPGPLVHIPDPRSEVVPPGWWQHSALPAIEAIDTWAELDEAAGLIQAAADYIEALGQSDLEYRKALRCVEARRGQLLGPTRQGHRSDLQPLPHVEEVPDVSAPTAHRWRQIADHWDDVVLPHLVASTDRWQVSQARCLHLIQGRSERTEFKPRKPPPGTPVLAEVTADDALQMVELDVERLGLDAGHLVDDIPFMPTLERRAAIPRVLAAVEQLAKLIGRLEAALPLLDAPHEELLGDVHTPEGP